MKLTDMSTKNGSQIVKEGYNKIAKDYHKWRISSGDTKLLKKFVKILPKKSKVLDAGCGAGVPVARFLTESKLDVTGIDISKNMIKLARENVSTARFLKMDMTKITFKPNSFDGIVSFYAIIHIPREKHKKVIKNFYKVLKPGGLALLCMGNDDWESIEMYKGTKMFWSQYAPEKTLKIIQNGGFNIIFDRVIKIGGESHYWILAKK